MQAWRDRDAQWKDIWDAGHYVVMVGYDDERLFFMDPSTMTPGAYAYVERKEFDERWHDLTGDRDERIEHMTIFARASTDPSTPGGNPAAHPGRGQHLGEASADAAHRHP